MFQKNYHRPLTINIQESRIVAIGRHLVETGYQQHDHAYVGPRRKFALNGPPLISCQRATLQGRPGKEGDQSDAAEPDDSGQ